jgi:hypothetical protein
MPDIAALVTVIILLVLVRVQPDPYHLNVKSLWLIAAAGCMAAVP